MLKLKVINITTVAAAVMVCFSGCVMIPETPKTQVSLSSQFSEKVAIKDSNSSNAVMASSVAWRDYFVDPGLDRLIELALQNNRDLKIAALTIEKTRALYQIQRSDLLPEITANAAQTVKRTPADLSGTGAATISRQVGVSVGFTSYELDFFGRVNSLKEQALQTYLQTEEAQKSAQISLIAEVVKAWIALAANQERLRLTEQTMISRQQSYDLTKKIFEAGQIAEIDLRQAQMLLDSSKAELARLSSVVAQNKNLLVSLVGTNLDDSLFPTEMVSKIHGIDELKTDVPSEILLARPDVVQAERALLAANANIGAARAAFFPSISLTTSVGTASTSLDGLFKSGSQTWSFIPQISIPIFNAGNLRSQLAVSEVQRDIALATYEKTLQTAFREVSDALAEKASIAQQFEARTALVEAAQATFKLTQARYQTGIDAYLNVQQAQRDLYTAQLDLIGIRQTDLNNRVTLYRVLGGGVK
jgi:multidrug efflux system outer membrane protein